MAPLVAPSLRRPKGRGFSSLSGHIPGVWVRSQAECVQEATHRCFSFTSMFSSISLPPFLSLSKIKNPWACPQAKKNRLYRFQVYISMIYHLYIAYVPTTKSQVFLQLHIFDPLYPLLPPKTERQPPEWEKMFANNSCDRGLISKLYKELIYLNTKQ